MDEKIKITAELGKEKGFCTVLSVRRGTYT